MKSLISTSSNPFTINTHEYFRNPFFKFKFSDCFLKLGNSVRSIVISLRIIKGTTELTVPITLNLGLNYFAENEILKTENISYVNETENLNLSIPVFIRHVNDTIQVSIKYSYLMQQGLNTLVLFTSKLDEEPISDLIQLETDIQPVMNFDYLKGGMLKLRLNDGEYQKNVLEIVNGVSTHSNLVSLIDADQNIVRFSTSDTVNPYGLNEYKFEIVDKDNELVSIVNFSGILEIKKN